jgi:hypothetical protein
VQADSPSREESGRNRFILVNSTRPATSKNNAILDNYPDP